MARNKIAMLLSAATVALGASFANAEDPLKIGFVYVGPTGDAGWTYAHDEARKHMEAQLGDKVDTSYVDSVAEGQDADRVIRRLA